MRLMCWVRGQVALDRWEMSRARAAGGCVCSRGPPRTVRAMLLIAGENPVSVTVSLSGEAHSGIWTLRSLTLELLKREA